ncbi:hypothetical protein KCP73_15305 [Salmonella enterica subsp. enterica]|nr:hypothetical protein KCP73_15305 [Salmonella enterica subsp. enterica]
MKSRLKACCQRPAGSCYVHGFAVCAGTATRAQLSVCASDGSRAAILRHWSPQKFRSSRFHQAGNGKVVIVAFSGTVLRC